MIEGGWWQRVEFDGVTWPVPSENSQFRLRGADERELFLPELGVYSS